MLLGILSSKSFIYIKVFRKVNTDGNKQHLQNDVDKLVGLENGRCYSILGNVNAYI